ncbi:retropepsin-like aspartic protease family protein [Noviherbaspirillum sedimenti]|uniref:TIGR02281 family clan AA aspartic protease n=1 Tax=Noviherbaspirillum sedimenti TaxID=2320865 RepID=A0A3A3G5I1_9BURK|nr:TIGR02281 family clan AA aspartic protease [Noviherbaspirillum sedimenti]RJG01762.1 TIGR02281 family clan AA aspartic protease [Noviherbaspirillum sedimenti]
MRSISCVATSLLAAALYAGGVAAADIDLIGVFPGKAVLVVNGGNPKTYSVGNTVAGTIKLTSVGSATATLEENGKRQTLQLGEHFNRTAPSGPASITLHADSKGHYMAQGQINGGTVRMLVDTGASMIALPSGDATRLGIDYKKGQLGYSSTANGVKPVYRVTLDTVRIGDIQLNQVEATVHEGGLPVILLGMSFLNRTDIRREGDLLTLSRRY